MAAGVYSFARPDLRKDFTNVNGILVAQDSGTSITALASARALNPSAELTPTISAAELVASLSRDMERIERGLRKLMALR